MADTENDIKAEQDNVLENNADMGGDEIIGDGFDPETGEIPFADEAAVREAAAEYYENIAEEQKAELAGDDEKNSGAAAEKPAKTGVFRFGFDIDDELGEELYEFPARRGNTFVFCAACTFVAAAFLCTAFYVGANRSSGSGDAQKTLDMMRAADSRYAEAVFENERLTEEIKDLTRQSLEAQELTGALGDYEDMKQALETRLEESQAEYQAKNDELYSLNSEIAALKSRQGEYSVTLTPGVYTVGKNLPPGTYNVTGAGSMIASTAAGEMKINMQLSAEPNRAELRDGYTVKLNKSTTFAVSAAADEQR